MQITRNGPDTTPGPSHWFMGAVFIDTTAVPSGPSRLSASSHHFMPCPERLAHAPERPDHLGPRGRRAGAAATRSGRGHPPGRRVFFELGEEHWHGPRRNGS